MRVTYAGVTIRPASSVAILELERRRPIYHEPGGHRDLDQLGWQLITRCGLWTYTEGPADDPSSIPLAGDRRGHWIPTRHAIRFARPCRRCYLELANATLELTEAPLPGGHA